MKPLKHTTLTLLLTLLLGCSKESTSVDVFVYEKGTSNPAVGIPVNFGYSKTGVFSSQVVEQTKTTDASGRVSFKGEDKSRSYSVGFPNGADYFGDATNNLDDNEHNRVFLYTYPFAYVRVHAKNVNPYDSNDWIDITNGLLGGGLDFMEHL